MAQPGSQVSSREADSKIADTGPLDPPGNPAFLAILSKGVQQVAPQDVAGFAEMTGSVHAGYEGFQGVLNHNHNHNHRKG